MVGQAVAIHGGNHAGRHTEDSGNHHGGGGQFQRRGPIDAQIVDNRATRVKRFAPVAAKEARHVIDVLDGQWLIQAEFTAKGFLDLFGGAGPGSQTNRVAGDDAGDGEGQDAQADEGRDDEGDAPQDVETDVHGEIAQSDKRLARSRRRLEEALFCIKSNVFFAVHKDMFNHVRPFHTLAVDYDSSFEELTYDFIF